MCLNQPLPLSFSSVCKKFPRQSCHEVFSAADLGDPRYLQPGSTFHCEHRPPLTLTLFDPAALGFTRSVLHRADPLRQRPECGGGRKANSEADHGSSAGDAVLLPPDQPGKQRRWLAAPRVRHDCARHPSHETLPDWQDQHGRDGDGGAAGRRNVGKSEVRSGDGSQGCG